MTISVAAKRLKEVVTPIQAMTLVELAKKCGVSPQSAQAWTSGLKRPTAKHRKKIAKITGIPEDAWDQSVAANDAPDPEAA